MPKSEVTASAKHECSCCGRDIHQTVSFVRENFFKGPLEYDHACHRLDAYIRTLEKENDDLKKELQAQKANPFRGASYC